MNEEPNHEYIEGIVKGGSGGIDGRNREDSMPITTVAKSGNYRVNKGKASTELKIAVSDEKVLANLKP